MLLAEVEAREHGATRLGLNVFGHNLVARRLYERLGYQTSSIQMQNYFDHYRDRGRVPEHSGSRDGRTATDRRLGERMGCGG